MGNNHVGSGATRRAPSAAMALTVACIALFTDALVYGIAVPVLPRLATDAGSGALGVGVLFAAYAGALVAVTPLAGWWIDRRGNREPLIAGMVGLGAATLLFGFATGAEMLFVGRALQGAAAGLSWTAGLALIAATHAPDKRGTAMGAALSSFGVGTLLGPVVGGLLSEWFDARTPFLVAFVIAVADGIARWVLVPGHQPSHQRSSAAEVRHRRGIGLVVLLTVSGAGLLAFLEPILPLELADRHQAGPGTVGAVFGVAALIAAAVPPLAGLAMRVVSARTVALAGCAVAAAGFWGIGTVSGVVPAGIFLTVVSIGAAAILTPTLTLMAGIAEARRPPAYGAVYAMYTVAYTLGLTIAPLAAGALTGLWSFTTASRGAAGAAALVLVAIIAVARRHPDTPTVVPQAAPDAAQAPDNRRVRPGKGA